MEVRLHRHGETRPRVGEEVAHPVCPHGHVAEYKLVLGELAVNYFCGCVAMVALLLYAVLAAFPF